MTDLDRMVLGTLKHVRRQEDRRRKTRDGLGHGHRMVLDELPPDIACGNTAMGDDNERESRNDRRRVFLLLHIREFTPDDRWITLIRRRLLDDESIREIAADLGLNYSSARRKVCEARRYLGLD